MIDKICPGSKPKPAQIGKYYYEGVPRLKSTGADAWALLLTHTRQRPDAPLSRVNQGWVILILSSAWGEKRKANNPTIMAKIAKEVEDMMIARPQIDFKMLAISQQATKNMLRSRKIHAFLSEIPASGAALPVLNRPECTSVVCIPCQL